MFEHNIVTKEVNYLKDIGLEKHFELSATELSYLNTIIVCIYGSSYGDCNVFYVNWN
jgi:hypothetical protein